MILMLAVQKATDVRKEFSRFINGVLYQQPAIVQRNSDYFAALSLDHLEALLKAYRFQVEYEQEENGSYSGSLIGFDIVANAQSLHGLRVRLAEELVDYAHEYVEEFALYSRTPNRSPHFPYIFRVLIKPELEHVVALIDA